MVREYPKDFDLGGEVYYPIPTSDSEMLYKQYRQLADHEENVNFIGRLACYQYYNMDQVVAMALKEFDRLSKPYGSV